MLKVIGGLLGMDGSSEMGGDLEGEILSARTNTAGIPLGLSAFPGQSLDQKLVNSVLDSWLRS